ncbi:MAG TPA: ribonuclease HII [Gemmatimonadales bacterium]|nr:ribonuclease HII [Gemmatimonadales bacterium]
MRGPSAVRERDAWAGGRLLVGVDEAGRGPLAGPVIAAAVAFPPFAPRIRGIRDSKTLPAGRRDRLAAMIWSRAAAIGLGAAAPRLIDRVNIRIATSVAMRRAIRRALGRPVPARVRLIVDGLPFPELDLEHEALVDGDALCYSVAAAGIIAKTVRDRLMVRLAARHPGYGWDSNMGYGTPDHLAGLERAGPTAHHRRSFAPVGQLRLAL